MIRVLPYMFMVLFSNIASWTYITGILKGWTFAVLFCVFVSNYLALKVGLVASTCSYIII